MFKVLDMYYLILTTVFWDGYDYYPHFTKVTLRPEKSSNLPKATQPVSG